jgi:hypothetical protein
MHIFSGIGDVYTSYSIIKRLTTPFKDTDAYRLGVIDENGKYLIPKSQRTTEQNDAVGMLDRIVFNLKKIMSKLPGGDSKIASYAAALWLIKETRETTETEFLHFMVESKDEIAELGLIIEEGPANAVGTGNIAGSAGDPPGKRKVEPHDIFASQAVFDVDSTYWHKCKDGKKKYHRYENYVGNCETGQAIREYGLKNPKNAILLRDKSTQAMIALRYGGKHLKESKLTEVYSSDKPHTEDDTNRPMTTVELNYVEKYLDRLYASLGIDIDMSGRHFRERLRDDRNGRNIPKEELIDMFKKVYTKWGQTLKKWGPGAEAVLADMSTDLNIPVMLKWDAKNKELDMVCKTAMVKKNFVPNNAKEKKLAVEEVQLDELKIEVPHPSETLGIPRHSMPQIVSTEYDNYFKYLQDQGIEIKRETMKVGDIKLVQHGFNLEKIQSMIAKHSTMNAADIKPLLVSGDNYLIDGNHRLLAMQNISKTMRVPVIRIKTTMAHALQLTKLFPAAQFKNIADKAGYTDADAA